MSQSVAAPAMTPTIFAAMSGSIPVLMNGTISQVETDQTGNRPTADPSAGRRT